LLLGAGGFYKISNKESYDEQELRTKNLASFGLLRNRLLKVENRNMG
jgi:hypothetical protein